MKALVLGGTGPTGPLIVDGLLQRGYEVTIMHSGLHEVEFSQPVEHIHGDVHFEETLNASLGNRRFDLVVAAYGRLRITADVMAGRTERFVSIGGSSAGWFDVHRREHYGRLLGPVDPDPQRDRFHYLMYSAEQTVMDHHQAGDYSATHIRYPFIYGPRQPGSLEWSIVRRLLDGRRQIIIAGDGQKLENRCYVDNAAHGILLAIDQPEVSGGKIYVVADEHVLTLRERVEAMAKALNRECELLDLPFALAKPFHPYSRGREHRLLDISRIKNELGYHDAVSAEEAVMRTACWLVENRPEPGGELERQLGDSFDYAAEDAMIAAYHEFERAMAAIPYQDYHYVHPYRHPKKPNEDWQRPEQWRGFRLH